MALMGGYFQRLGARLDRFIAEQTRWIYFVMWATLMAAIIWTGLK